MKKPKTDWEFSKGIFTRGKSHKYEGLSEIAKLYAILRELDDPNSNDQKVRNTIIHCFNLDKSIPFDAQIETLLQKLVLSAANNSKSDESTPQSDTDEQIALLIGARLEFLRHSLANGVYCCESKVDWSKVDWSKIEMPSPPDCLTEVGES